MSCVKLSSRLAARIWTKNLQLIYEFAVRRRALISEADVGLQNSAANLMESGAKSLRMRGLGCESLCN